MPSHPCRWLWLALAALLWVGGAGRAETRLAKPHRPINPGLRESTAPDLLVDPRRGSDITGQRNSESRPYRTLAAALSNALSGDLILCLPGTNYIRCAYFWEAPSELNIRDRSNITVTARAPHEFTLVATNLGDGFFLSNAPGSRLLTLDMVGFRTGYQQVSTNAWPHPLWAAIHIADQNEGTEVGDCFLDNWMNQGIAVLNGDLVGTTNAWIHQNTIARCGWIWAVTNGQALDRFDGAAIVPDAGWLVESNVITDCAIGIEVYPSDCTSPRSESTVIRNNCVTNTFIGFTADDRTQTRIEGNYFVLETNYVWIDGEQSAWGTPLLTGGVIVFHDHNDLIVRSNWISGARCGVGLEYGGSTNALLQGNRILNTPAFGVLVGFYGLDTYTVGPRILENEIDGAGIGIVGYCWKDAVCSRNTLRNRGGLPAAVLPGILMISGSNRVVENISFEANRFEGSYSYAIAVAGGGEAIRILGSHTNWATFTDGDYYTNDTTSTVLPYCPEPARMEVDPAAREARCEVITQPDRTYAVISSSDLSDWWIRFGAAREAPGAGPWRYTSQMTEPSGFFRVLSTPSGSETALDWVAASSGSNELTRARIQLPRSMRRSRVAGKSPR